MPIVFMKNICLPFSIIIFLSNSLFAQNRSVYEGPYVFQEKEGEATFEFLEQNGQEQVLDGFFRFDFLEKDSLDKTMLFKFQVTGEHDNNKRTGTWIFDQEKHQVNIEDVVDFKLVHGLSSEEVYVEAEYEEGIKTGVWTFKENVFVDGQLSPKADATGISFSEGKIVKNIDYRNFEGDFTQLIRGEINEEGYMDGEWSLIYLKDSVLISEVRNYENGFLLGIRRRNLETNDGIDEAIYFSTIEKLKKINESTNEKFKISDQEFGLVYNDGFRPSNKELKIQAEGNLFIDQFIYKLLQFDEAVNESGEIVAYPFFTKRFEYKFTENSEESLGEIPQIYNQLKDLVSQYVEMNSLALNKSKSDSLSFAYRYFINRKDKLNQMVYFLELIQSGKIRYFDMGNFTKHGIEFMSPIDLITYEFQGDTLRKMIPRVVSVEGNESFFKSFELYLREELAIASNLGKYVTEELYEIEVNSKLLAMEAEIIQQKNLLDSLYLNQKIISDDEQQMLKALYQNFLKIRFDDYSEQYAQAEVFEIKVDKGELILNMLNELKIRLPDLTDIYPTNQEIDKLYKEETFNPFTFSRYDVRAKERLFESGAVRLFNHYVEQLKNEQEYTQIKDHISKIQNLQERMIQLRNADTKTMERRLGGNDSINRIESALDL